MLKCGFLFEESKRDSPAMKLFFAKNWERDWNAHDGVWKPSKRIEFDDETRHDGLQALSIV